MEMDYENKVAASCLIDYTKCKATLPLDGDLPPTRCSAKYGSSPQARLKSTANDKIHQSDLVQESRQQKTERKVDPIVFTLKRSRAVDEASEHLDEEASTQLLTSAAEQDSLQEYALNFSDEHVESPISSARIRKDNLRQKSPNSVILAKSLGIESNISSPRRKSRTASGSSVNNDRILKLRKLTHLDHADVDAEQGTFSERTRSPRRLREIDVTDLEKGGRLGPHSRGHERDQLTETAAKQLFVASNRCARRKSLEMAPMQSHQSGTYLGASQIGLSAGPHAGDQMLIEMHQELRRASLHEELQRKQGTRPRAQSRTKSDRESLLALQATLRRTTISHRDSKEKENQYRRTKSMECSSPTPKPSGAIRAKSIPSTLRSSSNTVTASPYKRPVRGLRSNQDARQIDSITNRRATDFCDISGNEVSQRGTLSSQHREYTEISLSDWNPPEVESNHYDDKLAHAGTPQDLKHRVSKSNQDAQEIHVPRLSNSQAPLHEKSKSYAHRTAPIRRGKNIEMILRKLASNGLLDKTDKKSEVLAC